MRLRPRSLLAALVLVVLPAGAATARELRVCADPNNLPFSNQKREGLENRLVELIARDMGAEVRYTWWAQRRGYVRNTLKAGDCDVVPGVAVGVGAMLTTRPYYRSTYVFVSRTDRDLRLRSLDDTRLRTLKVGVQMAGDDFSNTPPAHALAARGVVRNVRGYMLYGDYAQPSPPKAVLDAVADGQVDVALVWGPLAGYFATREPVPITIAPIGGATDARYPMSFDIAMGVRPGDTALRDELNRILQRRQTEIAALLVEYGVPLTPPPGSAAMQP